MNKSIRHAVGFVNDGRIHGLFFIGLDSIYSINALKTFKMPLKLKKFALKIMPGSSPGMAIGWPFDLRVVIKRQKVYLSPNKMLS